MKKILWLGPFVALALIMGTFPANAGRVSFLERQPLGGVNPSTGSDKGSATQSKGAETAPDNKGPAAAATTANKGAETTPDSQGADAATTVPSESSGADETPATKSSNEAADAGNTDEDEGEVNENYNNYGQDSGTTTHRYFPCEERKSQHCR